MSVIMHNTTQKTAVSTSEMNASASFLEVIDPVNRTGKITIPMAFIQETRGMNELTRPKDAKDLSLCLLFQKGRCNAGNRCHQIHAEPSFVNKLRNQATTGSSCCALHGDFNSSAYLTTGLTVEVMTNGVAAKYTLQAFGRTTTMDTMMSNAAGNYSKSVRMNVNKLCRLHAQSRCKFGKDCKNVHICPNAKPLATASAAKSAPATIESPAPLSGFSRPMDSAVMKSTGPLGSSTMNTANRQMKSAPGLDVSRSELSNSCNSFGLSTCPSTPSDCDMSTRSISVESSASANGLSPNSVTPLESPKEKSFIAENSLFNRNCATPSPVPSVENTCAVASVSPIPQPNFNAFASDDDVVVSKTPKAAAPAMNVNQLVASIWEMPLATQSGSDISSPLASDEFEQTMSLLAKDLTGMTCSPSWSQ